MTMNTGGEEGCGGMRLPSAEVVEETKCVE